MMDMDSKWATTTVNA